MPSACCPRRRAPREEAAPGAHHDDKETIEDACGCCVGACYPNGMCPILFAQLILMFGWLIGFGSLSDCQFVQVHADDVDHILAPLYPPFFGDDDDDIDNVTESTSRGLGFFFFQDATGDCAYEFFSSDNNETGTSRMHAAKEYGDFLGQDWAKARGFGAIACALAFFLWIWVLALSCGAQKQAARYILAFLLAIVAAPLLACTFLALGSDLCTDELAHGCQFGRSAGLAVAALVLVFTGGVLLVFTKNYRLERQRPHEEYMNRRGSAMANVHSPASNSLDSLAELDWLGDAREVPIRQSFVSSSLVANVAEEEAVPEMVSDGVGDAQEVPVSQSFVTDSLLDPASVSCSAGGSLGLHAS